MVEIEYGEEETINMEDNDKMEDKDSNSGLEKLFDPILKRHEKNSPINKRQTKMRDIKAIEPSSGFANSMKNTSGKSKTDESGSSRKSERKKMARVVFEPALMTDEND